MYAQTDTIRYVSTSGSYNNDGLSWATPKNRLQDAINDLRDYMQVNNLTSGSVYVAAGTYVPTESTESSGGSMLNTSFKIYSGIHVYGGFNPAAPEESPGDRLMVNGKMVKDNWANQSGIGTTSASEIASQWDLQYKTILSGNHSSSSVSFDFDSIRGRFNTTFPVSSYHVVWFATNGKIETGDESTAGHYRPLDYPALVDGCVLTGGNASTRTTSGHEHTAYGGGAYMVGNSELRNCTVEKCNSTLRGGGVYLDGGGIVEFCYIHTCQSAGVGVVQGYGGGACIDHEGQVGHSHITNCAARCGGGLAICHIPSEFPADAISYYSPFSSACVINNNTASAEGGGIYLAEGGTINHATVTANNCVGPDVTYYGRRHGRSGGIYIRDCGMIFNSVFWGNKCATNSDIQFASVRQVAEDTEHQVYVYHSAFMNHDITDWTNVQKEMVFALSKTNLPVKGTQGNYPCFFAPTVNPLNWNTRVPASGIYGAGVFMRLAPENFPGPRVWHLSSFSALDQKGVQVTDAVQDASEWIRHAHTDYGVVSNPFEPASTLGALVRKPDPMAYALVPQQGLEGRLSGTPIPTLFIDPNRKGEYDAYDNFSPADHEGNSWDTPIKDMGEAISYFRQFLRDDPGDSHHYMLPELDGSGNPTGDSVRYDYVQILMKAGTITTAGQGNYLNRNIRTAAMRVESHMRLYGGYSSSLTGTSTAGRNPRSNKSIITANITGISGSRGYENNSAHVIAMVNAEHCIVDGFTLSDGNTHNVEVTGSVAAGGGVLISNATTPVDKRVNMTGNQLRNCVINNCTAPKGAAVYVNGEHVKSNGEPSYAELLMVNCVVRNNKADYVTNSLGIVTEGHGVITANGRAYIHIEHGTIVNNVGYPFKADSKTTDTDQPIYCADPEHLTPVILHGVIRVDNSIVFCNGDRVLDDRGELGGVGRVTSVNGDGQDYVFGMYNMFDADIMLHQADPTQPHGFFQNGYTVPLAEHFLPDGVESYYTTDISGLPADSLSRHNQCIFTRENSADVNYPTFLNPARNVGNTPTGDRPLYGGIVSYTPMTTNPCVNAAYANGYTSTNNFDRSDVVTRDRGGAPDIGAVENEDLPAAGDVIYVTPDGAGKRDGSSWDNAIAGNTVYAISSGLMAHANVQGDKLDTLNNTTRVINISTGSPVLTTDDRYQGGFARSWFTSSNIGVTTATTVTDTWVTEDSVFVNGPRDSERTRRREKELVETIDTEVTSSGTADEGFVAGWNDDTRYPYGEISGASRSFWRANPYHSKTAWTTSGYDDCQTFIDSCIRKGWINNTRAENYVGGLQYAVEKASAINKTNHNTTVQVWVGAGKYTDYKGFVMRDSVSVYGGFPAGKYPAPAMSERQALMSDVVNIPKSLPAEDLDATDYETILQISDINPNAGNTFNPAAVRFTDNDLSRTQSTDTRSYAYKTQHITNTYTYTTNETNNTSTYIYYPGFEAGSEMHEYGSPVDSVQKLYGNQSDAIALSKDVWHIVYPNTKTYYHVDISPQSSSIAIYDYDNPSTKIEDKSSRWYRIGNGSLTGMRMWQTMLNLEDGTHKLTLDFMGGYRNIDGSTFDLITPSGIYLHVLDAAGNELVTPVLFKCRGTSSPSDNNKDRVRKAAFRKTVEFTTTTTQDVTIYVEVLDGTKNTTSADATYGTDDGRDPDYIPWYYKWDKGSEASPSQDWGTKNPNRREFFITNFKLMTLDKNNTYALTNTDVVENDTLVENPKATEVLSVESYTVENTRTPIRKRVLTMPDVCVPTYGGGGIGDPVLMAGSFGDNLPHTDRAWGPTKDKRTAATLAKQEDPHYVEYADANWDGFTIRHGFLHDESMAHGGGSGVNMYEGGHLRNCIVINNISSCRNVKGGGIFCDGATSTIEGCFVLNNASVGGSEVVQMQIFAGGMFMYEGTCFNSLFANNYSYGSAGGLGFCVGRFFNNTVAYNTATLVESGRISGGAISLATSSNPNLFVANTVVYGNNGVAIRDRNTSFNNVNPFLHCYIQSEVAQPYAATNRNVGNYGTKTGAYDNYGINNIYLNGVAPSERNSPFAADYVNGVYTPGRARETNDYRLVNIHDTTCVNMGTEDFAGEFLTALMQKMSRTEKYVKSLFVYKMVEEAELPSNDVAFAKRIQDCQIDIGAYEFNAAYSIRPDTTTHPGTAIFYLSYTSPGGDASASSPFNAACKQKMQMVIDAAGRYKYALMTAGFYNRGYTTVDGMPIPDAFVSGEPNKCWSVEVWLEGDDTNSTTTDTYTLCYQPERSTKHGTLGYTDNPIDYSFIVPHGVVLKGGFAEGFYHYEDAEGNVVDVSDPVVKHVVDDRDPLTYRTVLSGRITSSTGAEGQCYHVVTFTNDLFDVSESVIDEGGQMAMLTDLPNAEDHRAVLDGLFIEDGYANSPDAEDRRGAGAVVTGYAHIRNCVVQNNEAEDYGGGLYLQPNALVSGTIIKKNTADIGGGIYIEAPENQNTDTLAHVFSCTICQNTATSTAGGMWFDNTNARVSSSVLWSNSANDYANVSGIFSRTSANTDYPFEYCAVESRRLEGQGNIQLSPTESEGVRWDHADPFNILQYYPIEMSSTLSRAGMTYTEWYNKFQRYTTLDSMDIAGVSRLRWTGTGAERGFAWGSDTLVTKNNDFIEIGARALNKNFAINVDPRYVMRRLFVMHTELLNTDAARTLQNNPNDDDVSNMYRQMGSCILNPFHRLGDAFDYIIAARKSNPAKYRNARFEVYVEQGTYYPYHNAYGEQDQVRNNTFLIPEATTVIGGINSQVEGHNYCQAGYVDPYTNTIIGDGSDVVVPSTGYTLDYALADSIRLRDDRHRPMRDLNLNSVIEPWELERQSILSGNAVSGESFTHSYHVITVHADSMKIGPQPFKFRTENPDADWKNTEERILTNPIGMSDVAHFENECERSLTARAIILDGIVIEGGYANHLDSVDAVKHPYQKKTYFRGGGILVDGFWTHSFDEDDGEIPFVTTPAEYNIPLVIRHCQFQDNMAANGGAIFTNGDIHVYSSHFTQNYSQGPMTKLDQKYIPWSAGGCIATNSYCGIVNTMFANNEARRGLYPINIVGEEAIVDADARQGFGGVLSVSRYALLRAVNNHFMRNKAVAYSAIYNAYPNNLYTNRDSIQTAFNSIFWGNEVFDVDNIGELEHVEGPTLASINAFNTKYKSSRAGVFHYDGDEWAKYERLFHEYDSLYHYYVAFNDTFNVKVTDKLAELRAQGNLIEGLFYCSYRKTYGPTGMRSNNEGYLLTEAEYRDFVDARALPVPIKLDPLTGDMVGDYTTAFTSLRGNNNVLINRVNNASDGPNFKQPSMVAGIDGYMQNADWLSARMNRTVDQGWGHLKQRVTRGTHYTTSYTGDETYPTPEAALAAAKAVNPSATAADVLPISGTPVATFDGVVQPAVPALYNYLSYRASLLHYDYATPPLPCGDDIYMSHTDDPELGSSALDMLRISLNPRMNVEDVYIDMGIYEYQYIQLDLKGNEIDTVWVATMSKHPTKQDGLSWEYPTTDLQAAIDLVMSSCNNHDKYVCLMGDELGAYAPYITLDNRLAFVITSNTLTPLLPDSASADTDYGVNSLTFLGGYSFDIKGARDPQANPTVIEMTGGNRSHINQLFVIEDMTREHIQANWMGEYRSRDNMVIPVTFDGLTFSNPYGTKDPSDDGLLNAGGVMNFKGGSAIYYRWQRQYVESDGVFNPNFNLALYPDSAMVDKQNRALPKLTISNCTFLENGDRTVTLNERSPAIRIDHGGGSSLIVNSLFHSNAGAPVYSRDYDIVDGENNLAQVPNDVVIVNSTFALNDGHVTMDSEGSEMHNSIVWLDDLANDTTVQLEIHGTRWDKAANANRIGLDDQVTHNAIWGCFRSGDDTYHNDNIVTENKSIFNGPYFVDPKPDATTAEQRSQRNFRINPGVKMMNAADTTIYRSRVFFRTYPDNTVAVDDLWWRRPVGFKSDTIYTLSADYDLGATPRLTGPGMERGAYECQAAVQRVVYVRPNLAEAFAGDGSSWDKAFGQGQLQNAIDVASVYTFFNQLVENPDTRRAYVYVKGSYGVNQRLDIIARDGVNVFGSIPGNFNDTAWIIDDEYNNDECRRYLNYARSVNNGVASPASNPTRINSIIAEGDYTTGFLLDGFIITNPDTVLESSPVVLNAHATLRNCIIADNHVEGAPIVDLQRGLVYNSLFYRDTAETLVKAGTAGLLLNNTIVASRAGDNPIDDTDAEAENIINNITYNESAGPAPFFAPYFTTRNPYALPAYLTQYPALGYQLHEHSRLINAGTEELPTSYNVYVSDRLVNFAQDRDILGNPRRIGGHVDVGAFETWRVEPKQVFETTSLTNIINDEATMNMSTPAQIRMAFTDNYGGNRYPHQGSVVYLMDSSALTMAYDDPDDFDGLTFRPGFMLMKQGASFYGNGHPVQMNYLAVEKRLTGQQIAMNAFPFDYYTNNITTSSYNSATDAITSQLSGIGFDTYQYNGIARSAKDYTFRTNNSALWLPVDTAHRVATEGYLVDYRSPQDTLLRFNAFAADYGSYVYTETGDDKIVALKQHDSHVAGTGAGLNFTRQEDMGWNMKGLPWLVSGYRTDTTVEDGGYLRQMHIPHVFYYMNGDGDYLHMTMPDRIYAARSWDKGTTLTMGDAFLTQTATMRDHEDVTFHRPFYLINEPASRPIVRIRRRDDSHSDYVTVVPDSAAGSRIEYRYGRDGVKWTGSDTLTSAYILDNGRASRVSLLGAAPLETDIPLGVNAPKADSYTFSLPEEEAFAAYRYVWLIDYERRSYTNLKEGDYTVELPQGRHDNRFALRIGGYPIQGGDGKRQYTIFVLDGTLHVHGLLKGDYITVFAPSGQLITQAYSSGASFTTPLPIISGYVVKVNDHTQKVIR